MRDGIDIDLSNLRYVHLDARRNLVTIGGATKFEQIWDTLQPAGKEIRASLYAPQSQEIADIRCQQLAPLHASAHLVRP